MGGLGGQTIARVGVGAQTTAARYVVALLPMHRYPTCRSQLNDVGGTDGLTIDVLPIRCGTESFDVVSFSFIHEVCFRRVGVCLSAPTDKQKRGV
jgi:hypothetical protein